MLTAVIIDDEKDSIDSIELIASKYCPNLQIIGRAESVSKGVVEINNKKPDLVFLDIEMPSGDGFKLLDKIPKRNFDIIFITAYDYYAIKAFKYSAVDYILKPINIEEFICAVHKVEENKNKFKEEHKKYDILIENLKTSNPLNLVLHGKDEIECMYIPNIIHIEADGSYTNFYLKDNQKLTFTKSLTEIQDLLLEYEVFFRVHRSHIVNMKYIKRIAKKLYGGVVELNNGTEIDISHRQKSRFIKAFQKYSKGNLI